MHYFVIFFWKAVGVTRRAARPHLPARARLLRSPGAQACAGPHQPRGGAPPRVPCTIWAWPLCRALWAPTMTHSRWRVTRARGRRLRSTSPNSRRRPPTTPLRRPRSGCRRPPIDGTWTEDLPHDPPHGGTTPDVADVAAFDDRACRVGQTEPNDFTRSRWDADRPHCYYCWNQSSPCL